MNRLRYRIGVSLVLLGLFGAATLLTASSQPVSSHVAASSSADFQYPATNLTSVAFGSCHKLKYASRHPGIWQTIWDTAAHPQMWLWTGDAVYPPSKGVAPLKELADEYRAMKASPEYAQFLASPSPLVIAGTYDDHDYGGNDQGRHMPDKAERARLFWDFVGLTPPPEDKSREGVYYSMEFGQPPHLAKVIILDTRYFRDDHCVVPSVATKLPVLGAGVAAMLRWLVAGLAPPEWCDGPQKRTILGEAQWAWLEHQLRTSQAALHVIVSSIQVLTTNPAMEGWGHFPSERRRLLELLKPNKGRPRTVLLSGDVHHAELLRASADLWEITSSGLTHDCGSPVYGFLCQPLLQAFGHNRASPNAFYTGRNFGVLSIDWERSTLEVKVHPLDTNMSSTPVLSTGPIPFGVPDDVDAPPSASRIVAPTMDGHLRPFAGTVLVGLAGAALAIVGMARARRKQQCAAKERTDSFKAPGRSV